MLTYLDAAFDAMLRIALFVLVDEFTCATRIQSRPILITELRTFTANDHKVCEFRIGFGDREFISAVFVCGERGLWYNSDV